MISRVTAHSSSDSTYSDCFTEGFIVMGFNEKDVSLWMDMNGARFIDVIGAFKRAMDLNDITVDDLTDPTIYAIFKEDRQDVH